MTRKQSTLPKSPNRGKAAGYIRVSQVGGRSGDSFLSPDLQRDRITAWAAYRGYTITEWYVDLDVSGRSGVRRPEFERMMQDAAAGHFEMVAVYRLTRFGRSVKDTAARYSELQALGVGLASVTEDLDTSTAGGKLLQNMLFALAEFESERIGEEWASVHANRRGRGLAHVSRGIYGYVVDGASITGIDPERAAVIEGIYRGRLAGESWRQISDRLEQMGISSPRGEPRWGQTTLANILRNPLYAGLVSQGDELIEAQHPAIIPRPVWEQVQALHPRHARLARFGTGLASGLVVCAGCDYHMARATSGGRRVYRCTAYRHSRACDAAAQITADPLDAYLEDEVARRLDPARMPHQGRHRGRDHRPHLQRRVDEATRAIDRLSDERYLIGSLSVEEYERQLLRLVERREQAQARLDDLAERPAVMWAHDWRKLSLLERQGLVRTVVARVTIRNGRGAPRDRARVVWAL